VRFITQKRVSHGNHVKIVFGESPFVLWYFRVAQRHNRSLVTCMQTCKLLICQVKVMCRNREPSRWQHTDSSTSIAHNHDDTSPLIHYFHYNAPPGQCTSLHLICLFVFIVCFHCLFSCHKHPTTNIGKTPSLKRRQKYGYHDASVSMQASQLSI
jgi:hypothetical protein